jgi:hypothetical protein
LSKIKAVAVLTVRRVPDMTPTGRKRIVRWLKAQASFIQNCPKKLGPIFTARYLYQESKKK